MTAVLALAALTPYPLSRQAGREEHGEEQG